MSMYWDINKILPYQRNFNLINGERSIGKTYTTQKWVVNRCLEKHQQFIYLVRTQQEKKDGVLERAFEKVMDKEFPGVKSTYTIEEMSIDGELVGFCIALSESQKIKKRSFPNVYYMIFDEYMIEDGSRSAYVSGWKEPDLLLSIYHTVDREEDRVKVFMLGNNTSFYNPYHLHPAFNVQPIKQGQIWTSENVLYQWAEGSPELKNRRATTKFGKMIQNTRYGDYASSGKFIEDNSDFIAVHDGHATYQFTIVCGGIQYGVFLDQNKGLVYISDKVDPSCPFIYALTLDDHSENVLLTKGKPGALEWFSKCIKIGVIRYENMYIKKLTEQEIYKLL